MAAPAFRAAETAGNSLGTSLTITKPTGTAEDDILIGFLAFENNEAVTASGWTLIATAEESATWEGHCWYKRAGASEPADYTWSWTSSKWRNGIILAYSGGITSGNPIDVSSTNFESGADTSVECLTITTTVVDTMIVGLAGNINGAGAWTPPSGMTERIDISTPVSAADVTQASAGATGEKVFTAPSSSKDVSFLLAIKPPAAGGISIPVVYHHRQRNF